MYRQNFYYPGYSSFRYNNYMPRFNPTSYQYATYDEICDENIVTDTKLNEEIYSDNTNQNNSTEKSRDLNDSETRQISFFGFDFALDDLIIVVLIFLLFMESENNIALIVILGLMLFNVNLSSLNLF